MADPLISVLLELLASITAQEAEQELWLVVGVDDEVRMLEGNLRTVHTVLNDAVKRQFTDNNVKLWLKKLEDTFYEMDDVLDEWNTAMSKFKIEKNEEENAEKDPIVKKKVCSFIPSPSCCFHQGDKLFLRNNIIANKIKKLNGKLDEIVRKRRMYGFELTTRGNASKAVERPKTTSFVDVSEIYGRDKVKDDLVNILLGNKGSEEEGNPNVVSLVGMGGIGKTTLAQLAYNDPEVKSHFEKRIWVCVSDPFDQCRVAKAILEALGGGHPNSTELQSLLEKIRELIEKKKFFLVLDDVWNENSTLWEPFRLALGNGAQGSRILATTRKSRVAERMGSTSARMINLEVLSEKDCWLVFSKIAFSGKEAETCEELEVLGRQIAKKCKGLPLAAKTMGSLLCFMRSREQWENVLNSNLWELKDVENVVEKELFAPLLLSYNDLPSPLKRCFSFCAIFPKDYEFHIDDLVFMWMAQGYIDSKENMEIIGREYFENLAIRSFFQDFDQNYKNNGKIIRCKMHDIVHDFAQSITKNESFTINDVTGLKSDYRNARLLHLRIPNEAQFPTSAYNAKTLRNLILEFPLDYNLSSLFQHFRCLRTLTLNFPYGISKDLLDGVENCMHLRYLNLVDYDRDGLPETICNLFNLQILKIYFRSPRVMKFPQGMGKLINLRHVILETNFGVNRYEFAREIGKLTSLRTLSYFNSSGKDDSKGCNIGELKNLNQLQGNLQISGLWNLVDLCEAENAQLKNKHLHTLKLYFDREYEERMESNALILNAIESPPNLESLSIGKYWGTTMSLDWMMSLTKLKTLKLGCLEKLEHLPPLGKLLFLERLEIWQANSLKKVGIEFLGIESENRRHDKIKLFPNLKSLEFHNLFMWEEWIVIEESTITIMPHLQFLRIWRCPNLKSSLPDFLGKTPLKKLVIRSSLILHERCQRGTGADWTKISHIPTIVIEGKIMQRDSHKVNYSEFDSWEDDEEYFDEEQHGEEEFDKEMKAGTLGERGQSSSSA